MLSYPDAKERYLTRHPSDRNVFLMLRYGNDHYHSLVENNIRRAFQTTGFFNPVFAKDLAPEYFTSIQDAIIGSIDLCKYGIAVFTREDPSAANPNIAFELGMMLAKEKDILILKDEELQDLFSDIVSIVYKSFNGRFEELQAQGNDLYVKTLDWLKLKERLAEDSLGFAYVARVESAVFTEPSAAVENFVSEIDKCLTIVAETAQVSLPNGALSARNLGRKVAALRRERQLTNFMATCLYSSLRICRQLAGRRSLDREEGNRLLGHARLLRDIYNSWLRNFTEYQALCGESGARLSKNGVLTPASR